MKYRFHKLNGKIADEFLALSVAHPSCDENDRPSENDRQSWRRPSKATSPEKKPLALRPVPLSDVLVPPSLVPEKEVEPRPIPSGKSRRKAAAPVPSPRVMLGFLNRKFRVRFLARVILDHLRLVIAVDNESSSLVRLEYVPETRSFMIRELLIKGKTLIGGSLLSSE